jgi:hypothetical protein
VDLGHSLSFGILLRRARAKAAERVSQASG